MFDEMYFVKERELDEDRNAISLWYRADKKKYVKYTKRKENTSNFFLF